MEVLYLIVGLIIGVALTIILARVRRIGTLVVYIPHKYDLDDAPYLTLELDQTVSQESKKRYVTTKVDVRKLNTHH